ncbi:MAG: hypothetical protein HFJ12_07570 [Bacilli bacterium]|nr:hypothetical protein [Bacilli bacterium]
MGIVEEKHGKEFHIDNRIKIPKKYYAIYFGLLALGLLMTIIRWYSYFNNDFVFITESMNAHISNFSLSMLIYLFVGFMWILMGVKLKYINILGIVLVIINLVFETVLSSVNTADMIDFIYGGIGLLFSYIFLLVTYKNKVVT